MPRVTVTSGAVMIGGTWRDHGDTVEVDEGPGLDRLLRLGAVRKAKGRPAKQPEPEKDPAARVQPDTGDQ